MRPLLVRTWSRRMVYCRLGLSWRIIHDRGHRQIIWLLDLSRQLRDHIDIVYVFPGFQNILGFVLYWIKFIVPIIYSVSTSQWAQRRGPFEYLVLQVSWRACFLLWDDLVLSSIFDYLPVVPHIGISSRLLIHLKRFYWLVEVVPRNF